MSTMMTIEPTDSCYPHAERARVPDVVDAFDKAVADELPRVSHVQFDSHEICEHFAGEVRKRLLAAR